LKSIDERFFSGIVVEYRVNIAGTGEHFWFNHEMMVILFWKAGGII